MLGAMVHAYNRRRIHDCGPDSIVTGRVAVRAPGGRITVGAGSWVAGYLVTETPQSRLVIGNNVFVGARTTLDCAVSLTIEDDVLVSYGCVIADSDNHSIRASVRRQDLHGFRTGNYDWSNPDSKPIVVRRSAWIGAHSIILKGVTIGEGAIIGAGSVVTRSIPAGMIAAGNPARVIRPVATPHTSTDR